jgi:hypothetical protein
MATETITVQAVAKQSRQYSGQTIWPVKVRDDGTKMGVWYNLYTETKPNKGESFTVDCKTNAGKDGRMFYDATIVTMAQPAQPAQSTTQPRPNGGTNNRTTPYTVTWSAYEIMAHKAHALAAELEPAPEAGQPRASIFATIMIAFGDGKIDASDGWESVDPWPAQPALYAETQAHIDLENALHQTGMSLAEASGRTLANVRELSSDEVQKILAKIEEKALKVKDWHVELAAAVQKYCTDNTLDFAKEKFNVLLSVAGTKDLKSLSIKDAYDAVKKISTLPKL